MPQRFLRPGITNSDAWNSVSFAAQSMYIRLLTLVDDYGRYDGRIAVLHAHCFALRPDINPQDSAALRSELTASGLVQVFTADGKDFIQILKWQERARGPSRYPAPPQESAADRCGPQESAANSCLPSPSHESSSLAIVPSPSQRSAAPSRRSAPNDHDNFSTYNVIESELIRLFRRPNGSKLTDYAEQSALSSIAKRKNAADELKELIAFKSLPSSYFPQSVASLLTNWQATLDRSRNATEPPKPKPRRKPGEEWKDSI